MRDGGRGRFLVLLEVASRSVSVGRGLAFESGVVGTGSPLAFPRPLPFDTGVTGAHKGDDAGGGVEGGAGTSSDRFAETSAALGAGTESLRAFFAGGLRPDGERGEVSTCISLMLASGVRARFAGLGATDTAGGLEDAGCGGRRCGRDALKDTSEMGEGGEHGAIGGGL